MKTQRLGHSDLICTRLSYGCMRYVETWNPEEVTPERESKAFTAIAAALDAGYTLFDHADIYCRGECEAVFGKYLKANSTVRKGILIATKCGIRFPGDPTPQSPHRYDFSAEHIAWSAEQSLKRLGIETIDLYQLHRPDVLMNPPEIAEAFDKLQKAGKVRFFGVSNFLPTQVSALQKHLPMKLAVNQVEIHLGRLDNFVDGTLDQCLELGITPLSWSPVGGGFLATGGTVNQWHGKRDTMRLLQIELDLMAKKYGVSRTVISVAWLLKHPSGIVPIVGSTNPAHIKDAAAADGLELTREDWYHLYVAARGQGLP